MKIFKKTNLRDFKEGWTLCLQCGACYYHGPIIPHNWLELPPPEWSSPLQKCPSFEYFKFKAFTAAGRGNLATLVFDDSQFPISYDLVKIAYTCTSCGMCSEICQRWRPLMAIWALREELVARGASLPKPLIKIDANIAKFDNMFGAKRPLAILKGVPTAGENIYFAGCNARLVAPEIARVTIKVLKAIGMDVAYLGAQEKCCGFILGHDGHTRLFEEKAIRNINALKISGAKQVIVTCAHCYKALKIDYPLVVGKLPFIVVHFSELVAELIREKRIIFNRYIDKKVTFHDPCFLGRHSNIYNEPRTVLASIPNISLVEMERSGRWSYCCGSGAKIVSSCYPEFSTAISRERLLEGKRAAKVIVTACTSCYLLMNKAVKKDSMGLEIYDLPMLVAEAMGI